jgi:uncharacterized membrane protein
MNFRLLGLTMASSVFVILYLFGDAITYLNKSGNLDELLVPIFGSFGRYLFEVMVPFASIALIFLSVKEAYREGEKEGRKMSSH